MSTGAKCNRPTRYDPWAGRGNPPGGGWAIINYDTIPGEIRPDLQLTEGFNFEYKLKSTIHELTHGFDDQGRQFDAQGNLRDWWTAGDAAQYKTRAQLVSSQFDAYTVADSVHVNGSLTLGENIADLGGLTIAYAALQKSLENKRVGLIDGFTPDQRFFLAWAQIWRSMARPETERMLVATNPHAPGKWRVNGPLSNMPEFARAFDCQKGDRMVRPESVRAQIW